MEAIVVSGKIPKALESCPELMAGMDFYLNAYNDLQYDRPVGMGAGPIPWSSIVAWSKLHGYDEVDEINELIRIIRALEGASNDFDKRKDAK